MLRALQTLLHSVRAQTLKALVISLHFVPGPACRGSVPLYVPPLSYKRGGMQRYNTDPSHPRLKFTRNTTHSGVGYYAPVAQTTLNPCVFLCVHPPISNKQNA
jgi:hypothetical protein